MKTNWLKTVNDINSKRYTIPDGWETRDQVAASLQCDPSKVADILKPGIDAGEIDRKSCQVWDAARRMAVSVVCYRLAGSEPKADTQPSVDDLDGRIRVSILRNPTHRDNEIAKNFRGVRASRVRDIRAAL